MSEHEDHRLSQIQTLWSVVLQAHGEQGEAAALAQQQLLQRYQGVVHRYLLGILHDRDAAEDLTQEFALRFMRGAFRRAHPGRGRFRDFLKTALRRLAVDHLRQRQAQLRRLSAATQLDDLADSSLSAACDFALLWRDEILARAWESLAEAQRQTGEPIYHALRCRAEQPQMRSAQMAEHLAAQLGRPVTAAGVRQALHRAREKFAGYLLEEVIQSLDDPRAEDVEEELRALGLQVYCQPALDRRALRR